MKIFIVKGKGEGRTQLSAFDAALNDSGVANYNLVRLSSIIPAGTQVIRLDHYETPDSEFGHKLYSVRADIRSSTKGKGIAAGIGWYQLEDNRGVFVEHETEGNSEAEARENVETDIRTSLEDLCKTRNITFNPENVNMSVSSMTVGDRPSAVLAIAVYATEGWE